MSVWLSMDMSYVGAGDYANSSKVAVNVYVHWDTPSYNGLNPALNVTVDGVNDTVNVSFNTGQTSSGSQNIYSRYWNVGHDSNGSARTVYASASYATGTTSGTVATSTSLSLAAIGGSGGGDSGGGDSGDDDTYYQIIVQGTGAKVSVTSYGDAGNYPYYKAGSTLKISVLSSEGYNMISCYINGVETTYAEITIYSDIYIVVESEIVPTVTTASGIYIDDGTNNALYKCYIDNGPETISKNCEIAGHKSFYTYPGFLDDVYGHGNGIYNMDNQEHVGAYYDLGYDTPINYAYVLSFKVPEHIYNPVNFTINIKASERISGYIKDDNPTMNYALCSSDLNYAMYAKTVGQLSENGFEDEFEIAHGTFSLKDTNSIVINEVSLNQQNDMYYLFIWDDERVPFYSDECAISFYSASRHTVTCTYVGNQFNLYIPYIDNGTSWEIIS